MFILLCIPFLLLYYLTRNKTQNARSSRGRRRIIHDNYHNLNLNASNPRSSVANVIENRSNHPASRTFNPNSGELPKNSYKLPSSNDSSKPRYPGSFICDNSKNRKGNCDSKESLFNGKSKLSLTIEAYDDLVKPCDKIFFFDERDKNIAKNKEKGCLGRMLDCLKSPFSSRNQQNESCETSQPHSEVMRHESPQKLSSNKKRRRGSTSSLSSEDKSNYVPLHTSAINYIKKLISDIHGIDRWKAITHHFKPENWLGEDDVTNLIRLAAACLPFPQKFAWVTSETMSTTIPGYDYAQGLENYSKNTEFVILPCCTGVHFTFWTYNIQDNNLTYYDPRNHPPSDLLIEAAMNVVRILFNPSLQPPMYIQTITEAMRQKDDFNCGVIVFDIILCLMKNRPLYTLNYNPNISRKLYYQLLKTVYEKSVLPTTYFLDTANNIPLPKLSPPENIENDQPIVIENVQKPTEESGISKTATQFIKNESSIVPPKKTRAKSAQNRKIRFQNLHKSGEESRAKSRQLNKSSLPKVQKIKKSTKGNVEPRGKSEFHERMIDKRWSTWNSKRDKIEQSRAKSREGKIKGGVFNNSMDFDDVGFYNDGKLKPDLIIGSITPPAISPAPSLNTSPKLKYTPRILNKKPNSIWKTKKRAEEQLKPMFPGFRPEIVLHPENMAPENKMEKFMNLKVVGNLKKRQVEEMSKSFKAPSYPTLMKAINSTIPKIPDVPHKNIEGRTNVIFKDFYSFVVARIQNSNKLPKEGPINISIQADTGDDHTLFTFSFVDVNKANSPSNHACFAMFDGSDKAENIADIAENANAGAERLQREGIVVNGIRREVICFLNGDLKIRCTFCGCQGGSAKRFCCKCDTESDKILGKLRTINEISQNYADLQAEFSRGKQNAHRLINLKQRYNSVNGPPLFPSIPLTRVCPPPLHILMALLNKFLLFIMRGEELKTFLKQMNVSTIPGRSELTGMACRQILQNISASKKSYKVPQKDIFLLIAKIEKYAEARKLKPKEIDTLEKLIKELFEKLDAFEGFSQGNKLHELRFHLIPFLRDYESWGLFSEQGLEGLHKIFKEYRAKIIATEDDLKKNEYSFKAHMQHIFVMKM